MSERKLSAALYDLLSSASCEQVEAFEPQLIALERRAEAAEARLKAAEDEMRRIGYGTEPIFVFTHESGPPHFTSLVGDCCWDTVENRRRTFAFIENAARKEPKP